MILVTSCHQLIARDFAGINSRKITMAKWILAGMLLFCGCASQRVRVTVTRVHGEPAVSIEFEEKEIKHETKKAD